MAKNIWKSCVVLLVICCFAMRSESGSKTPRPSSVTHESVMEYLKSCDGMIKGGKQSDNRPVTGLLYLSFAAQVGLWLKNPDLEADTGIEKSWYMNVRTTFEYMAKARRKLELAKMDRQDNSPDAEKEKNNFLKAYDYFQKLLKNPTPVSEQRLEELRRLKRERRQ